MKNTLTDQEIEAFVRHKYKDLLKDGKIKYQEIIDEAKELKEMKFNNMVDLFKKKTDERN